MKKYVLGFAFNSTRDYVVLIQKNKPEWQKGCFNGVGGKIEEGETPLMAMIREFKEETGLETKESHWRPIGQMTGGGWECDLFASYGDGFMEAKTMEDEDVAVLPVGDIVKGDYSVISNVPFLIELCRDEHGPQNVFVKYAQ